MSQVTVYDSGALIAIENPQNWRATLDHNQRVRDDDHILVPSVVAAQVIRDPQRQARLMTALKGCSIVPFTRADQTLVGMLLAAAGTSDVVDGFVALLAAQADLVVTSDAADIARLLGVLGAKVPITAA